MTIRTTLFTLTAVVAASTAAAQPSTSPHEATATAAYDAGDLETALREFEAAYVDTKRPDLLYVIARLHGERKDCARAIDFFQRYLATRPGQTQSDAARTEITKCQAILDAQRPPPGDGGGGGSPPLDEPPVTPPVATNDASTTTASASTAEGSRSSTDKLGIGLIVAGVVAEGAAVAFYVQARKAQCGDPVCTELSYEEYLDAEDKAKTLRLTSIIVASVGAVLVGGGIYRLQTRDKGRREPALTLVPTRDGAALSFSGRF